MDTTAVIRKDMTAMQGTTAITGTAIHELEIEVFSAFRCRTN